MVINSVVRIFILLLSRSEENLGEIFLLFLFSLIIDFSLRIHWYFHVKFHDSTDNELPPSADVSCWVFSLALIGCLDERLRDKWLRAVSSQCF